MLTELFARIATRLSAISAEESMVTITEDLAEHFLARNLDKESTKKLTGDRTKIAMLTFPFVCRNLAQKEVCITNYLVTLLPHNEFDPIMSTLFVDICRQQMTTSHDFHTRSNICARLLMGSQRAILAGKAPKFRTLPTTFRCIEIEAVQVQSFRLIYLLLHSACFDPILGFLHLSTIHEYNYRQNS